MLLYRSGHAADARIGIEVTIEVDRAFVENGPHDVMSFAKSSDRPVRAPFHAVLFEHRDIAESEDDLCATATQFVEGCRQLGDVAWIAHQNWRYARAKP